MNLQRLPTRIGGAAENMALDFLLLQRYPEASAPRFRHYGWRTPACTFGYAQKIAWVRQQLTLLAPDSGRQLDLCRRPTGGGIVDHRDDWTYALVIPRGHPLEAVRATQSYRAVHEALADALRAQGVDTKLKPEAEPPGSRITNASADLLAGGLVKEGLPSVGSEKEGVCFERAEIFDVVHAASGRKIAGAAQKRNKHGLLFQGSISRLAAGGDAVDWEKFEAAFIAGIATALGTGEQGASWPTLNEEEVSGLMEQYGSPEWNEYR